MKRRVQPLMACDTLGFEYTSDDDTSRMPGGEVDDDDIVERLTRIFKDAARPPKEVSSRTP
jgi:ketosteroid isomerase-like protein